MSTAISNRTFGIELEIVVPAHITSEQLVAQLAAAGVQAEYQSYNHNLSRRWKFVSDGSLHATNGWCIELVSPVLSGTVGLAEVRKVCEVLVAAGVKTNRTCGYHVHHGARDFKPHHFEQLFSLYRNAEQAIDLLMPESRRSTANRFAQTLKGKSADLLMRDRYHKLNLCSFTRHGTVEFRHHAGTINPDKVCNWVLFTQRMVERSKRKVTPRNHDYTWYDVKQLLGLVHTRDARLLEVASFYEARRERIAVRIDRAAQARLDRAQRLAAPTSDPLAPREL